MPNVSTTSQTKDKTTTDAAELKSLQHTLTALHGITLSKELRAAGFEAQFVEAAEGVKTFIRAAEKQAHIAAPSNSTNPKGFSQLAAEQIRQQSACAR